MEVRSWLLLDGTLSSRIFFLIRVLFLPYTLSKFIFMFDAANCDVAVID